MSRAAGFPVWILQGRDDKNLCSEKKSEVRSEGRRINVLAFSHHFARSHKQIVIVSDFCRIFSLTLQATVCYLQLGPSLIQMGSGKSPCLSMFGTP